VAHTGQRPLRHRRANPRTTRTHPERRLPTPPTPPTLNPAVWINKPESEAAKKT
jgi:hypothetical protein